MTALTLTPDPATGSVLLEITGAPSGGATVYTGTAEASVDGWAAFGGATLTRTAAGPITGGWSWRIDWPAGPLPGADGGQRTITGLTVGVRYRLTGDVRVDALSPTVRLAVTGKSAGEPSSVVGAVQRLTYEFVATATSHVVRVEAASADGGFGSAYFDNIDVSPAPVGPTTITRADANGTGPVRLRAGQEPIGGAMTVVDYEAALTGLVRYDVLDGSGVTTTASTALDGTAHSLVARRNHIPNPSYEHATQASLESNASAVITRTSGWAEAGGTYAYKIDAAATAAWSARTPASQRPQVTAGQQWAARFRLRAGANIPAARTFSGRIRFYNEDATAVMDGPIVTASLTANQEHTFTLTGTTPAGMTRVGLMPACATAATAAGESFYVDRLLLEPAAAAGEYFDGDTTDTAATTYAWEGVTGASPSVALVVDPDWPDLGRPWLGVPVLPQFNRELLLVTGYTADRPSTTTVHTVVDRADQVATLGQLLPRSGRMRLGAADHADAQALVDLYDLGEVVLLRQPTHPRLDLYHVATRVAAVPESGSRITWWVEVDYTEVAIPTDPLLGALGWTFSDIVASYPNFATVTTSFDTFADLVVGP